jgi:hypothetical protein
MLLSQVKDYAIVILYRHRGSGREPLLRGSPPAVKIISGTKETKFRVKVWELN